MFPQKPLISLSPDQAPTTDWAHGFHYLAPQTALLFGSDRREPVPWRPGVSLARRGIFTLLLPATRRPNLEFFHLKPGDLSFTKQSPKERTDSYLSYQYEAVSHDRLIELGVLRHGLRIDIAAWLQQRWGGDYA